MQFLHAARRRWLPIGQPGLGGTPAFVAPGLGEPPLGAHQRLALGWGIATVEPFGAALRSSGEATGHRRASHQHDHGRGGWAQG